MAKVSMTVNGKVVTADVDPRTLLVQFIRENLHLTGTHVGCDTSQCGACTVHVDGAPARSCQIAISDAASLKIVTIEGVSGKAAEAVRAAWRELDVPQCGYCQSGQIMSAVALLTDKPTPTDADIDDAMDGNVCRCATYHRIRAGIHRASEILKG